MVDRSCYAEPAQTSASTPSIVLAMHLWGVDADTRQAAERFAAEGFAVEVPDLYAQFDAPSGDGETNYTKFVPFAQKLTTESVDAALLAAARRLKERFPDTKTAIAGFCMGGKMALHRAVGHTDVFSAAAVWYGAIEVDPAKVEIPLVASFGETDKGIPLESVEKLETGLHVPHDIKIYPDAGHAFCDSTRAAFESNAAEDSWRRVVAFLRKFLVAQS